MRQAEIIPYCEFYFVLYLKNRVKNLSLGYEQRICVKFYHYTFIIQLRGYLTFFQCNLSQFSNTLDASYGPESTKAFIPGIRGARDPHEADP